MVRNGKSGFAVLFLLFIIGSISVISFLIAFKKIPIQFGNFNKPLIEVQQDIKENSASPETLTPSQVNVRISPTIRPNSTRNSQTGSTPYATQNTPTPTSQPGIQSTSTPIPTSVSTNPGKGKQKPSEVPTSTGG